MALAVGLGQMNQIDIPPNSASHTPLTLDIPKDVQTALNRILNVEPHILRSVCCPKCFKKYELHSVPEACSWHETPKAAICGESLLVTQITSGGPKVVPRQLYSTQSFKNWLEYFLSRPGIEDLIDKSYVHQPNSNWMESIWDSPSWRSLGDFTTTPGNLTFSYYIDWFNPLTNKIAGKTASCGAIIASGLNLPYELQHLHENTYFVGITPPPHELSVVMITHLSDPVVDDLLAMWNGDTICTHNHPNGTTMHTGILPGIGDLLAIKKAFSFAGTQSHNFCHFCKLHQILIDDTDWEAWALRNGGDVLAAATNWHQAATKKERAEIFQAHGVRWSALHRLHYCDPVKHTVLGVMHNWSGILEHHACLKWGIGESSTTRHSASQSVSLQEEENMYEMMDVDQDELEMELTDLH
jgi:hypothetical protein